MVNNLDNLPDEMRRAIRWLLYKNEPNQDSNKKKPRKAPYYTSGVKRHGVLDSPADCSELSTFEDALRALNTGDYAGLGFALGLDGETGNYWQGIDVDGISDHPELSDVVDDLPGYTEQSPSGNGMHAIGYGRKFQSLGSNTSGIEAYSSGRFFTVTADCSGIHPPSCLADFIEKRLVPIHRSKAKSAGTYDDSICESITSGQITDLRSALFHLRADDRELWVRIGHALKVLSDVGRGLFMEWSSQSDKFDLKDAASIWESFKPIKTSYKTVFKIAQEHGWLNPASKAAQSDSSAFHSSDSTHTSDEYENASKDKFDITRFSLNGDSEKMKLKMLADTFVLGKLALLGQVTFIYAPPNTGKTLLVLRLLIDAITRGEIKAEDVFYINADDNHTGLTYKIGLAEKYGFQLLAPGYNDFRPDQLESYLMSMIDSGAARGKILILDTVKKFTDIMDKKQGTIFGKAVRQFSMHGGTLVGLAHTNKNRNEAGQLIYSGTSDLVDDCDCSYTLDTVTSDDSSGLRTVKFKNIKNRGDVALEAIYKYDFSVGKDYQQRLDSVRALSNVETQAAFNQRDLIKNLESNQKAITVIKEVIRSGVTKKTEIINAVMKSGISKLKVEKALKDHEGPSLVDSQFWQVRIGDNNAHIYFLN
jgi:hypothetical protein